MSKPVDSWLRALRYTQEARGQTLPGLIDGLAATHGERPALSNATDTLSYRLLAERVAGYAGWAIANGIAGQTVGLLLGNSPDYMALWLGLARAGCTVALLNTKLQTAALRHCLNAAGASVVVTSESFVAVLEAEGRPVWLLSEILEGVAGLAAGRLERHPPPRPQDTALYIYTSGTTGLPKATCVTHARIMEWSCWFAGMTDARPEDRLYNCLPMYHSVGGVVATGSMIVRGGSVFIRDRFSAGRFWDDVVAQDCSIVQYIGELCRYLTQAPPDPGERTHRLRLAVGNGLSAGVWPAFQERFRIPRILEFYAATEGNLSLYNVEGKPGAIGRIPAFLAQHFATAIVRCDPETGEALRGADGFCLPCAEDEPGEAVSRIGQRQFDGYRDAAATERKILRDVFASGDRWFRSGDLMRRDAAGYFYFVDRLGDTFRWKGENVSTTEVENVIRAAPGIVDAVVYGVSVPGHEGRAGMAAVTVGPDFTLSKLVTYLQILPEYARPLFVRRCETLDSTGTFKLSKHQLARQSYCDSPDPVWNLASVKADVERKAAFRDADGIEADGRPALKLRHTA